MCCFMDMQVLSCSNYVVVDVLWGFEICMMLVCNVVYDLWLSYLCGYGLLDVEGECVVCVLVVELGLLLDDIVCELWYQKLILLEGVDLEGLFVVMVQIVECYYLFEFCLMVCCLLICYDGIEVVIFGCVSSGKLLLVNVLLECELLFIGVILVIVVVICIRYGDVLQIEGWDVEGCVLIIVFDELVQCIVEGGSQFSCMWEVVIIVFVWILVFGLIFIDMLGFGLLYVSVFVYVFNYLLCCDLGIVVIDVLVMVFMFDIDLLCVL